MHLFDKILIANRGEIAVRIIKTAKRLAIQTVAVYSPADQYSLAVQMADEAYPLPGDGLTDSYLNINRIIEIAELAKVDAIHPGYGFLSENPAFVKACVQAGIVFIGPPAEVMHLMGNKIEARKFAEQLGIPMTKGFTGSPTVILNQVKDMSFPVLIKAAAGGGGKGMRIIHHSEELEEALIATSREASNYFGDPTIYVERYLENPRHIEIQLLGDKLGNVIHLFERECTIQRRYQKIIEEAPAVSISEDLRTKIAEAAVLIARSTRYESAGTIEFLVENNQDFFFLEMNTRIQVEHPVTEFITGMDIVEEQLKIASGYPLSYRQKDLKVSGHSIECRIYAEDAENHFQPSPGKMTQYIAPSGPGIRVDAGIDKPGSIHPFYDPMISKLIVHGTDREHAIKKMIHALELYSIQGIKTNIPYLLALLNDPSVVENKVYTRFCETNLDHSLLTLNRLRDSVIIPDLLAGALYFDLFLKFQKQKETNVWQKIGYWRDHMLFQCTYADQDFLVRILKNEENSSMIIIDDKHFTIELHQFQDEMVKLFVNGKHYTFFARNEDNRVILLTHKGYIYSFIRKDKLTSQKNFSSSTTSSEDTSVIKSQMPGKIVKINHKQGDQVQKGDVLLIVESMKMENNLICRMDGTIENILVTVGENVDSSRILIKIS